VTVSDFSVWYLSVSGLTLSTLQLYTHITQKTERETTSVYRTDTVLLTV